jgi:hypothetical protein
MHKKLAIAIIIIILISSMVTYFIIDLRRDNSHECGVEKNHHVPEYITPYNLPDRTDDWIIKDGDWIVESGEIIENSIILLNGNLFIEGNPLYNPSVTIFNNVTLIINTSYETEGPSGGDCYWFQVKSHFYLNNSIVTVFDANYCYWFSSGNVYTNVRCNNSVISYAKRVQIGCNEAKITNCTFKNCREGLKLNDNPYTNRREIKYCLFENNSYGIKFWENPITDIKYNIFKDNAVAVDGKVGENKLEYNYWGTSVKTEIASQIYDMNADFDPWLDEPPF